MEHFPPKAENTWQLSPRNSFAERETWFSHLKPMDFLFLVLNNKIPDFGKVIGAWLKCRVFPWPIKQKYGFAIWAPDEYSVACCELIIMLTFGMRILKRCTKCDEIHWQKGRFCSKCLKRGRSEKERFLTELRVDKHRKKIDEQIHKEFISLIESIGVEKAKGEYKLRFKTGGRVKYKEGNTNGKARPG